MGSLVEEKHDLTYDLNCHSVLNILKWQEWKQEGWTGDYCGDPGKRLCKHGRWRGVIIFLIHFKGCTDKLGLLI